jgi:hypothetical protein
MKKHLRGKALYDRDHELGISIDNKPTGQHGAAPEHEVQRHLIEFDRARRESQLWIIALVSAIASVVSAIAAWVAVVTS